MRSLERGKLERLQFIFIILCNIILAEDKIEAGDIRDRDWLDKIVEDKNNEVYTLHILIWNKIEAQNIGLFKCSFIALTWVC